MGEIYTLNPIVIPLNYKVIYSPSRETCAKYFRNNGHGYVHLRSPDVGFYHEVEVRDIVKNSKCGGKEYEVIPKSPFFFSVANPYSAFRYYIIVFAQQIGKATKIAHEKYGCGSGDAYTHEEFKETVQDGYVLLDVLD